MHPPDTRKRPRRTPPQPSGPPVCDRGCAPPPTTIDLGPHIAWHDRYWRHPIPAEWPVRCNHTGERHPGCLPCPPPCEQCGAQWESQDTGRPASIVWPPARHILRTVA